MDTIREDNHCAAEKDRCDYSTANFHIDTEFNGSRRALGMRKSLEYVFLQNSPVQSRTTTKTQLPTIGAGNYIGRSHNKQALSPR